MSNLNVSDEIIKLLQEMTIQPTKEHQMNINGKAVDVSTLTLDGLDRHDYPDFADAYYDAGEFEDGSELTEDELEYLRDTYPEHLNMLAYDYYVCGQ